MAQEENQRCSNSSSGGGVGGRSLSKKLKQKKIPQRGLGVAQLEKIRLEEQQKKETTSSSPFLFLPLPQQSSSSISYPPPSPTEIPAFRPNFDLLTPPAPPPPLPPPQPPSSKTPLFGHNGDGSSIAGVGGSVPRHGYFPSVWNPSDYEGEVSKLDPDFAFQSNLLDDFNQISPSSVWMQMKQQQQLNQQLQQQLQQQQQQQQQQEVHRQHVPQKQKHHSQQQKYNLQQLQQVHLQPHSSKVNVSTPLSSGLNRQMEPPSNQSSYSNYTLPLWPEEEKMVGMKRPWPFSLDNLPGTSAPCTFPPFVPPSLCRLDESPLSANSSMLNFKPGNLIFSDGHSSSIPHHLDWRGGLSEPNPKKVAMENGALDTLLTLGRPAATNSTSASKAKQPLEFPVLDYPKLPEFRMPPYQGYTQDRLFEPSGSVQVQPFYSFFPPRDQQVEQSDPNCNDRREKRIEINEPVDLNLKL